MKQLIWMLCINLLLILLLAGCTQAAEPKAAARPQSPGPVIDCKSEPADSRTGPEEVPSTPIDSTSIPIDSAAAPAESSVPSNADTPEPTDADGMYLLINGARVEPGMRYADVRDCLGGQTAPDQEIGSCDNPSFVRIVHFYPGLTVTENPDGVIWGMELSSVFAGEGDAALKGTIRIGTPLEEVLAILGEPENASSVKEDRTLIYQPENQDLYIFLDPDGKDTVTGISMTLP